MLRVRGVLPLATAAALVVAGCVSPSPASRAKSAVVLSSPQFLRTGPMAGTQPPACEEASRRPDPSPVLTPDSPWIGTFGLSSSVTDTLQFGLGIEVPTPLDRRVPAAPYADRLRDLGVGAWVSIDF